MSKEQYFLQSANEEVVSEDDDVPLVSTASLFFRKYFRCVKSGQFLEIPARVCETILAKLRCNGVFLLF